VSLEVSCYSGHTYAERPATFVWRGRRYVVQRILKQWHSPQGPGFHLVTVEGERFTLTYHKARDQWFLQQGGKGSSEQFRV
jgi:hypothetical protein